MTMHTLTKKARGYCPYLSRDHSIRIEGQGGPTGIFQKTKMDCSHAALCETADERCPIYRQV